jgi:hypothetical protein
MYVTNDSEDTLVAVCFHTIHGCGDDVTIDSGKTAHVRGPYLGEVEGEPSYALVPGWITCHTGPDTVDKFHVGPGKPLTTRLSSDPEECRGVFVRHHEDPVVGIVCELRNRTNRPTE